MWLNSKRNPRPCVASIQLGTRRGLPVSSRRKVGTTSSHHAPHALGRTRANGNGGRYTKGPSSRRLQPACVKSELLVIADQHAAVNRSRRLTHRRHTTRRLQPRRLHEAGIGVVIADQKGCGGYVSRENNREVRRPSIRLPRARPPAGAVRPGAHLTAAYARHGDVPRHERMRTNYSIPKRKRKIKKAVRITMEYDRSHTMYALRWDPLPPGLRNHQRILRGYQRRTAEPWHRNDEGRSKLRKSRQGGANGLDRGLRMGNRRGHAPPPNHTVRGTTEGTETSKYRRKRNQPRSRG